MSAIQNSSGHIPAFFNRIRKMLVRFEKKAHNYLALIHFACTMIAMKEAKVQKALVMRNREREQNKLRMRRVGEAQVSTNEAEKHICNYTREQ